MKKMSFIHSMMLASFVLLFAGCHEEPLRGRGGADCGGCEDIPPGGGTVTDKCADLVITSVSIESSKGNVLKYTVSIKNAGTRSVDISGSNLTCQGYLSVDGSSQSIGAGGVVPGPYTLIPGQVVQQHMERYFDPGVDLSNYPFLIVELITRNIPECRSDNNTFVLNVSL